MATKDDMIAAIQAAADSSGSGNIQISLGTPGNHVLNSIMEMQETGKAWTPEPKTWPIVAEGLAAWADAAGIGDMAAIKAKINELIASHNQFISDYNANVIPTTAVPVVPLP